MKAWIYSSVEKLKQGSIEMLRIGEAPPQPIRDLNGEFVEVIPAADYDAQQTAIAAAVTTLQFALIDARRVGDTVACHTITEALALLRAVNEEADDA